MQGSALMVRGEPKRARRRETDLQLMEEMREIRDSIARRAFEIFASHGEQRGHELEHWLQAEMEFLHPAFVEVSESPKTLSVRADVPGFKEKDVEIEVEPRRVTIAGKRVVRSRAHTQKRIYAEIQSDVILRVIELPATVDTEKVTATVKDGVLELDLVKV